MKLPNHLNPTPEFLNKQFRHKAVITKGHKVIASGECNLAGTRQITNHFGKSCHAEINALKQLYKVTHNKGCF